jgi:hypothetical protein
MLRQWYPLVLALLFVTCAAPTRRAEVPLSEETFISADSTLHGYVPKGWFASTDAGLFPHLAVSLIREDYAVALAIQEIHVDRNTERQLMKNGLEILAQLSFRLRVKKEKGAQIVGKPKWLDWLTIPAVQYEYSSDESPAPMPVLVFRIRDRYFESSVTALKPTVTAMDIRQLSDTQIAVVARLR